MDHADEAKLNKLEAAHQKYNSCNRERIQNNKDEHHWLKKLVDNGVRLDHADEVKLNKLEAACQKNNSQILERYHKRTAKRWTCKVCNACSFDTAEKAEAHETPCAVKNSLDTKWACDVCKYCSFGFFEDAEAHEKQCNVSPLCRGHKRRKDTYLQ
jgi:hypothetical protein